MSSFDLIKSWLFYHAQTIAVAQLTDEPLQVDVSQIERITPYSKQYKVQKIGIGLSTGAVNCDSQELANQMATNVALLFKANIGVSVTETTESSLEKDGSPPSAYCAIWHQWNKVGKIVVEKHLTPNGLDRIGMQEHVALEVVNLLAQYIQSLQDTSIIVLKYGDDLHTFPNVEDTLIFLRKNCSPDTAWEENQSCEITQEFAVKDAALLPF